MTIMHSCIKSFKTLIYERIRKEIKENYIIISPNPSLTCLHVFTQHNTLNQLHMIVD